MPALHCVTITENEGYGGYIPAPFETIWWARDLAQLVECLPNMHEALGAIASVA